MDRSVDTHAADGFHGGFRDRLAVGDDGECFKGGLAQAVGSSLGEETSHPGAVFGEGENAPSTGPFGECKSSAVRGVARRQGGQGREDFDIRNFDKGGGGESFRLRLGAQVVLIFRLLCGGVAGVGGFVGLIIDPVIIAGFLWDDAGLFRGGGGFPGLDFLFFGGIFAGDGRRGGDANGPHQGAGGQRFRRGEEQGLDDLGQGGGGHGARGSGSSIRELPSCHHYFQPR